MQITIIGIPYQATHREPKEAHPKSSPAGRAVVSHPMELTVNSTARPEERKSRCQGGQCHPWVRKVVPLMSFPREVLQMAEGRCQMEPWAWQETEAEGRNWKPMKCRRVPLASAAQGCQCRQQKYHMAPTVVASQLQMAVVVQPLLEARRAEP